MKKIALIALLSLTACASLIEGKMQRIAVNSTPAGATCEFMRDNAKLGEVVTPGALTIYKSNLDITIKCRKDNLIGSNVNEADIAAASFGNFLTNVVMPVGLVGTLMDTGSGSSHKYDSVVNIKLRPSPTRT